MEGMEGMDRKQPDAIGKNRIEPKVKSLHFIHCLHCYTTCPDLLGTMAGHLNPNGL